MTREETKELLLHILMTYEPKDQYGDYDDPEPYEQALTMAIEALSADTVSRDVYDKRTQADEEIIDSYRQEFQTAISADAEYAEPKPEVIITDTDIMYVGENYKI